MCRDCCRFFAHRIVQYADQRGVAPVRALSIRQPYAELILRGIKRVEYRAHATKLLGERFWIYAPKKALTPEEFGKRVWSNDLAVANNVPAWMLELAEQIRMIEPDALLPTGVVVGSAVIEKVTRADELYAWHLGEVERLAEPRKPTGHPQPVWFNAF